MFIVIVKQERYISDFWEGNDMIGSKFVTTNPTDKYKLLIRRFTLQFTCRHQL